MYMYIVLHCPLYKWGVRDVGGLEGILNPLNPDFESCDFSGLAVSPVRSSAKCVELNTMDKDAVPRGDRAGGGFRREPCFLLMFSFMQMDSFREGPGMPLLRCRCALSLAPIVVGTSPFLQILWLLWKSPHRHANNRVEHVDTQLLLSLPICFNWSHTVFPSLFVRHWFNSAWDQLAAVNLLWRELGDVWKVAGMWLGLARESGTFQPRT